MADPDLYINRLVGKFILTVSILSAALFVTLIISAGTSAISFGALGSYLLSCRNENIQPSTTSSIQLPSNFTITIFTAPISPFTDSHFKAIESWLALVPVPRIVLLGNDSSFYSVTKRFGDGVTVEPYVDRNLIGSPQVHSIFARANVEYADIVVFLNTETQLLQDAVVAFQKASDIHANWLLICKRLFDSDQRPAVVLWAWNNRNQSDRHRDAGLLTRSPIPPFSHVAGTYDDWILHHLVTQTDEQGRAIVDASEANIVSTVHAPVIDSHINNKTLQVEANRNRNILGSSSRGGNDEVKPAKIWKLIRCAEQKVNNLCMIESVHSDHLYTLSGTSASAASDAEELRLEELLPLVADENNLVIMVGGTSNYKEMLMSFICNVKALGVKEVLVAAFDEALFEYAYTQGLAVYYERYAEDYRAPIKRDGQCKFNSECFIHVSKLKSWSVLRVLKRGYHVLWTDMDIVWFKNPIRELLALGPGTLAIQSDQMHPNVSANTIRSANSGFYLARAEDKTIKAFKAIVGLAMTTDMTEQPSFYDVLCGVTGKNRIGDNECNYDGLKVIFLSRDAYPNGAVFGHWKSAVGPVESCRRKGCVLLHNNYVSGKKNKLRRVVMHRMWFYDVERRMCLQPWHPLSPAIAPLPEFQAHFVHALNL